MSYNVEVQYLEMIDLIKNNYEEASTRETRSGKVNSLFSYQLEHKGKDGFPLLTTKKVNFGAVVGELLFFLSGKCDLPSLRHFSDLPEGSNTIWSSDYKDYKERLEEEFGKGSSDTYAPDYNKESLGKLYGHQWRNFGGLVVGDGRGTDQITNLIESIKEDPYGRRHIVTSYDPSLSLLDYSLKPCHLFFQMYVTEDNKLDLQYYMRSNDLFLGAPFNIASYALLQRIICKLTEYSAGNLTAILGDAHIYASHFEAVDEQLTRKPLPFCDVELPEFESLDELVNGSITAKDFKLIDYKSHGAIKAPLQTQVK